MLQKQEEYTVIGLICNKPKYSLRAILTLPHGHWGLISFAVVLTFRSRLSSRLSAIRYRNYHAIRFGNRAFLKPMRMAVIRPQKNEAQSCEHMCQSRDIQRRSSQTYVYAVVMRK